MSSKDWINKEEMQSSQKVARCILPSKKIGDL